LKNGIPGKALGMPSFYDRRESNPQRAQHRKNPRLLKGKPRVLERINNFIREL
jgi:hypothetical protein